MTARAGARASDLSADLREEVTRLEDDLRVRVAECPEFRDAWRAWHQEALARHRTAASWQEWADDWVTLAALAWVLVTVFIRFIEDNQLVGPVWIAGSKHRRNEALEAQAAFLHRAAATNPDVTDREWLLEAVSYLSRMPATHDLVDETSALWLVTPSGAAASRLLEFWRERDESGELLRDLRDDTLDTRFLGDLDQGLSQKARSRYALPQTPVFVAEFILDQTLEPALKERPLDGFRMIDPACGAGHFLLGAFERLRKRWDLEAPGMEPRDRVQKALDVIHGVDLNPHAVAISRFRLTIAALKASGEASLEAAPAFAHHLAVGDSLLHGLNRYALERGIRTAGTHTYPTEDLAVLFEILQNGRYDVVVGDPPDITVKDRALSREYWSWCRYMHSYHLAVPFMARSFDLAKTDVSFGGRPGWVGQITCDFMAKREFGASFVERFLARKDLRLVADTSGAYIPGHGTPTLVIVGRNRGPVGETVRAILGMRDEPGRPREAAKGLVWTAVAGHVGEPGYSDEWVTVTDLDRKLLARQPWSLSGGSAMELKTAIERGARGFVGWVVDSTGFLATTGEDDAYAVGSSFLARHHVDDRMRKPFVGAAEIGDWSIDTTNMALYTYDDDGEPIIDQESIRFLWPLKQLLLARRTSSGTQLERGLAWWRYSELNRRLNADLLITFALVSTHAQFFLAREKTIFSHTAPVIKLPRRATEDDHLALLGVLNSSTACFWLKQRSHDRGSPDEDRQGVEKGVEAQAWELLHQFRDTTVVQDLRLPATLPLERGRVLDELAQRLSTVTPHAIAAARTPSREALDEARIAFSATWAEMIAQQEELDWAAYRLFGLVDDDLTYQGDDLPALALGERAFEIVLARRVANGDEETAWFARHGSTPITEIPGHWPPAYRDLVRQRITLIESHPYLRLLERPEYKRRWAVEVWDRREERALRGWLLDRLEERRFWFDEDGRPVPRSIAQLSDDVSRDCVLVEVLALWEGRADVRVVASLERLLAEEAVPYLAAYRYKETGMRRRAAWEHTWDLQRREDAGEQVDAIPAPPRYTSTDFMRQRYWLHRGKLDIPKERFILYPDAGHSTDPTAVLGWAGWDHAQQAFTIDHLLQQREAEGWADEQLIPLVAGLAEVLPWVRQWHGEPDDFYGGVSPAEFFGQQLDERCRRVERTVEQLRAWRPASVRGGRSRKAVDQ